MNALAVIPFDQVMQMAKAFADSGLFGMKSPTQALSLMLVAQAEGQHPATIAQDYDIIQGRAARKTHSVLARFQQSGGRVEWHELTVTKADATFCHPSGGSLRMVWTLEQAQKAGLTGKDNWKNYPRAMLRARVIAEGVRAVYPAAIGGMLVAEEAQDLPPSAALSSSASSSVAGPAHNASEADAKELPNLMLALENCETDAQALQLYRDSSAKLSASPRAQAEFKSAVVAHRKALAAAVTPDTTIESEA